MQIDTKTISRAKAVATRKNNQNAQRYPLFAASGILDQVVGEPVTVQDVFAKREVMRSAFRENRAQWAGECLRKILGYYKECERLLGTERCWELYQQSTPYKNPYLGNEYRAEFWNKTRSAACTDQD